MSLKQSLIRQMQNRDASSRASRKSNSALANEIDRSPRQVAQRQIIASTFRPAVQLQEMDDDEPLQGKFSLQTPLLQEHEAMPPMMPLENRTSTPDHLKVNLEAISGFDLSDVRIHPNFGKPAQLSALAYAHGNEIHLGPGQEQHLPQEVWHVVQQGQGTVQAERHIEGVAVNDEVGLEEADEQGARAARVVELKANPAQLTRKRRKKNQTGQTPKQKAESEKQSKAQLCFNAWQSYEDSLFRRYNIPVSIIAEYLKHGKKKGHGSKKKKRKGAGVSRATQDELGKFNAWLAKHYVLHRNLPPVLKEGKS